MDKGRFREVTAAVIENAPNLAARAAPRLTEMAVMENDQGWLAKNQLRHVDIFRSSLPVVAVAEQVKKCRP
jgi:hypothetical protein